MFTSRRQSEAIETRSVFSSAIHHAYVVHIQENVVLYSRSAWPLTSRLQAAFSPTLVEFLSMLLLPRNSVLLVSVRTGRE